MQLTKAEVADSIIVTTPEKWDVVTRNQPVKGRLHQYADSSSRTTWTERIANAEAETVIIDEVHLLSENVARS